MILTEAHPTMAPTAPRPTRSQSRHRLFISLCARTHPWGPDRGAPARAAPGTARTATRASGLVCVGCGIVCKIGMGGSRSSSPSQVGSSFSARPSTHSQTRPGVRIYLHLHAAVALAGGAHGHGRERRRPPDLLFIFERMSCPYIGVRIEPGQATTPDGEIHHTANAHASKQNQKTGPGRSRRRSGRRCRSPPSAAASRRSRA